MWWYLDNNGISWFWLNDLAAWEASSISCEIVVLSELVNTKDGEDTSVSYEVLLWVDLFACQISITNELLSWLVDAEGLWEFLSSQIDRE